MTSLVFNFACLAGVLGFALAALRAQTVTRRNMSEANEIRRGLRG